MAFHVGQKVVHVGWETEGKYLFQTRTDIGDKPTKGAVYTVSHVCVANFVFPDRVSRAVEAIKLVGLRRDTVFPGDDLRTGVTYDLPWGASGFRPLVEAEDSAAIKLFRKIAADATAAKKITVMGPEKITK